MPGPPRKTDAERRRRNKDGPETEVINLDNVLAGERVVPVADEDWEPVAYDLFQSLKQSGQAIFMEPSDWSVAYMLCEQLSRGLAPVPVFNEEGGIVIDPTTEKPMMRRVPMPGATLNAILKGLASLMATEGDRRRLRLELERQSAIDAAAGGAVILDIVGSRDEAFRQAAKQG